MAGGSILFSPFASPSTTLHSILGSVGGSRIFLAFSLLASGFITLVLFHVAFVLLVTMFATEPTDGGTPEEILMVHCFFIFSVLLLFELHQTFTAQTTVRGMTRPLLVIDRLTVQE